MTQREKKIGIVMFLFIGVWSVSKFSPSAGQKFPVIPNIVGLENSAESSSDTIQAESLDLDRLVTRFRLNSQIPEYSEDPRTDPFGPLDLNQEFKSDELEFSDLVLSGIFVEQAEDPVALINQQILKKGDSISDFTVEDIDSHRVVLSKGLEKYTLRLFPEGQ